MRFLLEIFIELINLPRVLKNLFQQRNLIRTLTLRDFAARYRGSFGGLIWSIIQPLLMMVMYTAVFSSFLKVKFGSSDSPFIFAIFLLCGLLPWSAFSESLSNAVGVIRGNSNLVKRVVFPLEILPLNLTLVSLIQQVIGFVLLIALAWAVNGTLHWTLVFLPLIFLLQFLFLAGINWLWASLAVYLPDLRQVTPPLLLILMFLTPIFYPADVIPPWAGFLLTLNPLARIIEMYRQSVLTGSVITAANLGVTALYCLAIFLLGYFWFNRTRKGFPDVL